MPENFKFRSSRFKVRPSLSAVDAKRHTSALLKWFAAHARDLPWRRTRDPYAIWVSEIMLQQTQVKTVIPYWERWLRELPDLAALATAAPDKIHKLWEGLGYYTRVRNMQLAAQVILENYGGRFPEQFDDLLALPGIGRYTAGAIASIAFDQPAPILDGNVIRFLTRLHGIAANPREKKTNARLWTLAGELVQTTTACSHLNQSLMELGALICTPRQPRCLLCPVRAACVARREGTTGTLPNLGPRATSTARRFMAFVVTRRGRFLVRQRPVGAVNAHLWEFPNVETGSVEQRHARSDAPYQASDFTSTEPLCSIKHSITRYRIQLDAFRAKLKKVPPDKSVRWCSLAELEQLAFTSAHRKILKHLGRLGPNLPRP